MRWDFFVRHYSDDERAQRDPKFVADRGGVLYPRAGTLGGCTAHNAMITISGHEIGLGRDRRRARRPVVERRRACAATSSGSSGTRTCTGGSGSAATAAPRLRRLAHDEPARRHRGSLHDGALLGEILSAARSELRSAVEGLSRIEDYHRYLRTWLDPNDWRVAGGSLRGLWLVPLATAHGRRNGTRERIQHAAAERHGNLVVRTHALVTKVVFDDEMTAVGVEYLDVPHAYARRSAPGTSLATDRRLEARARPPRGDPRRRRLQRRRSS